ncbi:MAG: sugar phosphate nucleotidyltransferase [Nocardioidaceae bacterium]
MDAVIIAGGFGSRLRPLTDRRPKHLLPVAGVPFLVHQLTKLAAAGVGHVVLATSYRAAEFRPVLGDGSDFGLTLSYLREPEPLGTGGAIRNAVAALSTGAADQPVVVLNGDTLSGHDIAAQVSAFAAADADVSLHLVSVADPRPYGCVVTDEAGRVTAFAEKSPWPLSSQINAGCYVFRREIMTDIAPGRVVSVERETFPEMLRRGRWVVAHLESAYWLDVGTPATLVQASTDLVRGIAISPAYRLPPADRLVHETAAVDDAARITGGSVIGPGSMVAAGAVVEGSVLLPDVRIDSDAVLVASAVGEGARIGAGSRLREAVVGDGAMVGAGCRIMPGVRIARGAVIADGTLIRAE